MLTPTTLDQQYEKARNDDLKVLIVGAGVAGVTIAQLLRRDGRHPILIDRADDESSAGYMLALLPMVDPVLDDLGVREHYRAHSIPFMRYGLHAHTGKMIREDPIASILARFGDYRGISREELLGALSADGGEVTFGTTVTALTQPPTTTATTATTTTATASTATITSTAATSATMTTVTVATGDESRQLDVDLVIIADGIHSTTRDLVLGDQKVAVVDTHWGGWVVWTPDDADSDLGEELWGAGFFLGVYPVKGALGVFLGGPRADTVAGPAAFVSGVRRRLTVITPRLDNALTAITEHHDPYYWSLTDCRAPAWALGHTILLGDAAAGFLPTAGVGAGMAMESAWVLSRILRHAGPDHVVALLRAYERAQRARIEAAQNSSRTLARIMFHRSRALAIVRDTTMRFLSIEAALKPIQKLLAEQPDPDQVARDALRQT